MVSAITPGFKLQGIGWRNFRFSGKQCAAQTTVYLLRILPRACDCMLVSGRLHGGDLRFNCGNRTAVLLGPDVEQRSQGTHVCVSPEELHQVPAQRLLGFSIILPPSYVVMPPDRASNSIVFPRFSLSQGCHQLILCRLTRSTGALSPRMCLQSTALGHSVLSWKCMVAARTHARRSCPEDL